MNAHDASAVIHVLLQIFFLMAKNRKMQPVYLNDKIIAQHLKGRWNTHQVLKHQRQALVSVDNVMQGDDIGMLQVFQ